MQKVVEWQYLRRDERIFILSASGNSGKQTRGWFAYKAPFCAEAIQPQAIVCRYCGRDLPPAPKLAPALAMEYGREVSRAKQGGRTNGHGG